MPVIAETVFLLILSNVLMTFAFGHTELDLGKLESLQGVSPLTVFIPFAWFSMKEPVRLNYLWAALCLCRAVFFVFRR